MILRQLQENGQFNIFAGAGISKLPPAYAPVWREMLIDFSGALFTCMKRENWPAVEEIEEDLNELRRFDFRPETFWQRILNNTSLSFICDALKVVNLGQPNLNHRVIAELVRRNIVHNIVTTNFDEYLELELINMSKCVVNSFDIRKQDDKPILFKVHGTVSDPESMQFTLDHTKALAEWKSKFLAECLANRPLLIVGYSGYDDDVMPVLLQLGEKLPEVIVIRYPGSSSQEPIQRLGNLQNVRIIDLNISNEIRDWAEEEAKRGHLRSSMLLDKASSNPDLEGHYLKALSKLTLPTIPYILSTLFELAANSQLALQYAYLADDAREDSRYTKTVSKDLHFRILNNLSLAEARTQHSRMSTNFMNEASQYGGASVLRALFDQVNRVFEYFQNEELSEDQVREIEMSAAGALKLFEREEFISEVIRFRAAWCMGRLRNRQKQHGEAISYYQMAGKIPDELDDIQKGCFFLDYGSALFQYSVINQNDEALASALKAFLISEAYSVKISDHMTAAKAMMNIARVYYFQGEMNNAIRSALQAERTAKLTGDLGLRSRAYTLLKSLET